VQLGATPATCQATHRVVKPIIIGAGRGRRLGAATDEIPKTLVPIVGRPMLDHILHAFDANGFTPQDVVFICGYKAEVVRERHPEFAYVLNDDWPNNNILRSLLYAREHLHAGFISSYSDIVYRPEAIACALASEHDICLVCDRDWRRRYRDRTQHPEGDAEKVRADGDQIIELSRCIAPHEAAGEFIGVMKLSSRGAEQFLAAYDAARDAFADDDTFCEGRSFQKAYLIDLFAQMVAAGTPVHAAFIDGGYMEIDTTEDAAYAASWWAGASPIDGEL
jgi:choline kinase